MDNELHPELAFQAGIPIEQKKYEVHPSLQAEVEPEETKDEPVVQATDVAEEEIVVDEPVQESPKDRDWRLLRQQADEAKQFKREKEAADRERDFYREQALKNKQTETEQDDFRTDTEKRLAREMEELRAQVANQQKVTEQARQQSAIARAEQRLAQDYPDIRDVVSDDNIKRLEIEYPHLYNSVIASSDVYSVGAAAYEMIVAKGIYKKQPNALKQIASQNSASKNINKPRSASTVSPQAGETPIKQANTFMGNAAQSTEEERKALWAEMSQAARNKIF